MRVRNIDKTKYLSNVDPLPETSERISLLINLLDPLMAFGHYDTSAATRFGAHRLDLMYIVLMVNYCLFNKCMSNAAKMIVSEIMGVIEHKSYQNYERLENQLCQDVEPMIVTIYRGCGKNIHPDTFKSEIVVKLKELWKVSFYEELLPKQKQFFKKNDYFLSVLSDRFVSYVNTVYLKCYESTGIFMNRIFDDDTNLCEICEILAAYENLFNISDITKQNYHILSHYGEMVYNNNYEKPLRAASLAI